MYVTAVCQLFYLAGVRRAFGPIRVTKIALHHADSCVSKTDFLLTLFKKHLQFLYIVKMKSKWPFMNGNKMLTLGLYRRMMTGFVRWPHLFGPYRL